jgi:tetratricopeptide (TPR) repeat protein
LGVAGTPLEMLTPTLLATGVAFQTEVSFQAARDESLLAATDAMLAVLEDDDLPPGFRKAWHIAVAGHLHGMLELVAALDHASRSVERFPSDPDVLVAAGALDETLASRHVSFSTRVRAGVVTGPTSVTVGRRLEERRRVGFQQAESLYRSALALAPDHAEAKLRLGRVLALTGRGELALRELDDVRAAPGADARARYLAALFAGGVHETTRNWPLAIEAYRRAIAAADLPTAGIALSHALHESGDPQAARAALDHALERDRREQRSDPWWDYPLGTWRLRGRMLAQLRGAIR